MWMRNVLLGCQIRKLLQSRQWRDYKSYISNSWQLSYISRKTKTYTDGDENCVERHKKVLHTWCQLACSALAQTLYLTRHNVALKILFFEMLKGYQLADAIPTWYSPVQPKPVYQEEEKTLKYAPLRLELKRQHPGFKIGQFNIVIDALGGYSRILKEDVSGHNGRFQHKPPQCRNMQFYQRIFAHLTKLFFHSNDW